MDASTKDKLSMPLSERKTEQNGKESSQKDNLESPSLDVSSSILEFLDQERKCLKSGGGDASDADIKSILEEINRLSSETNISGGDTARDDAGERSVEEILKEAERLVKENTETFGEPKNSSKNSHSTHKSILSVKQSSNKVKNIADDIDVAEELEGSEDEAAGSDPELSYDDSFDTSSDVKSLPDDRPIAVAAVENGGAPDRAPFDFNRPTQVMLEDLNRIIEAEDVNPLNVTFVQTASKSASDEIPPPAVKPKVQLRDSCTSPVRELERGADEIAAIEKTEERIRDLEERLQAAKLQHNSVAGSFRNLTVEHSALQSKTSSLQAEVTRLQEALKSTTLQLGKHMEITEQLREANYTLQKNVQVERDGKQALTNQDQLQKRTIQDLQRQVREMERILARKHPDSVSALIVASKIPTVATDDTTRKLLEDRISQLEDSSRQQSLKSQSLLQNVQDKFNNMQVKYETHITDLESQVFSLQQINMEYQQKELQAATKKDTIDIMTQTDPIPVKPNSALSKVKKSVTIGIQTSKIIPRPIVKSAKSSSSNLAAQKEETHLLATIRGLNQDLSLKEKLLNRLTRELDDCKKTIKKLQKDREAVLKNGQNKSKEYDPQTFTCSQTQEQDEISSRTLQMLQREYHALVEKRLHDLNSLQNSHERELSGLERTIHALHNRIHEKDATILSLKGQIKTKVSALEKRQIEREQTLKALVSKLSNGKLDKDWINM